MKLVISPAKSLNYESKLPTGFNSENCFLDEAKHLNALLKKKSPKALSDLMHISPKLSTLNYNRNQEWSLPFTSDNARQAIYAFSGDVYRGLDAYSISEEKLDILHVAVCKILTPFGFYKFDRVDKDGWPHWIELKALKNLDEQKQGLLMKKAIIKHLH